MRKHLLILGLVLVLAVSLFAGCSDSGSGSESTETVETVTTGVTTESTAEITTEAVTEAVTTEAATEAATDAPATQPPATQPPATEPPPTETMSAAEKLAKAQSLVGQPVSALYAAIGYPSHGSSYATSCDGPGDDGELYYDGFTVYTYRENGSEKIVGAFAD